MWLPKAGTSHMCQLLLEREPCLEDQGEAAGRWTVQCAFRVNGRLNLGQCMNRFHQSQAYLHVWFVRLVVHFLSLLAYLFNMLRPTQVRYATFDM